MIQPAEQGDLDFQPVFEQAALGVFREKGQQAAEKSLTSYASQCATHVGSAYFELVDYLMLRYLVGDPEFAPPALPRIAPPSMPDTH